MGRRRTRPAELPPRLGGASARRGRDPGPAPAQAHRGPCRGCSPWGHGPLAREGRRSGQLHAMARGLQPLGGQPPRGQRAILHPARKPLARGRTGKSGPGRVHPPLPGREQGPTRRHPTDERVLARKIHGRGYGTPGALGALHGPQGLRPPEHLGAVQQQDVRLPQGPFPVAILEPHLLGDPPGPGSGRSSETPIRVPVSGGPAQLGDPGPRRLNHSVFCERPLQAPACGDPRGPFRRLPCLARVLVRVDPGPPRGPASSSSGHGPCDLLPPGRRGRHLHLRPGPCAPGKGRLHGRRRRSRAGRGE